MYFAPVVRTRDRSFDRFVNEALFNARSGWLADRRAQVSQEDDKAWTITLDVPGVAREDLTISVEGAVVRIATRAEAPRQYKAAYELPQEIDVDATSAKLENGVLTLTLGKLQPVSRARTISVA